MDYYITLIDLYFQITNVLNKSSNLLSGSKYLVLYNIKQYHNNKKFSYLSFFISLLKILNKFNNPKIATEIMYSDQ